MNSKDYEEYVKYRWKPPAMGAEEGLICYISTCMAGECGEACDAVKKYVKGTGSILDVFLELGDTLYYLTALANHFEISLDELMQKNKEKLDGRNQPA